MSPLNVWLTASEVYRKVNADNQIKISFNSTGMERSQNRSLIGTSNMDGNGLLLIGSGLVTYLLTYVLTFFLAVRLWNNRKHELKKWLQNQISGNIQTKNGSEQVGGLESVPGPRPLGKFIGNTFQCFPMQQTLTKLQRFTEKYGSVVKLFGCNETVILLTSPENIQTMLRATDFSHVVKAPVVYDLMKPFITNGVLVSRGKFWQTERKILLRSMTFQSLRAYITMLNNHSDRFVKNLEKLFQDELPHTINEEINSSFLEVICEMITGYDINGTEEGIEYHHNFQTWKETIAYRLMHPWFIPNLIWRMTPMAWETNRAVQGLFDFARRRIAEHRGEGLSKKVAEDENNNDVGDKKDGKLFRSVLDELVDAGVDDDQIVDEVNTMLFGGHETGASTIHFYCFAMAINPEIQEQCRKEVDEIFADPMSTVDGRLSYEAVGNLKYVERCILETLRLYPPVWAFLRQLEAPIRMKVNGKPVDIPTGSNICISPYILHRKKEFFPDPEKFDPDRFLPEECASRHAYAFIPFSGGSRNCLGLKFGMIEMKMVAAYLLKNFYIKTADKPGDVALLPNLTLSPERDYNFIFKKRTSS